MGIQVVVLDGSLLRPVNFVDEGRSDAFIRRTPPIPMSKVTIAALLQHRWPALQSRMPMFYLN
jgi:hypothetical protein